MEDLTDEFSKRFGISFKKSAKVKDGLLITCAQGNKIIKKTEATHNKIMFSHSAKELLYSRGYKNIDRYRCAKDGKPFVEYRDEKYVMTDVIDSTEINFDNGDILEAFTALAQIHKILKGSIQKDEPLPNIHTYYFKRKRELNHIRKWINSQSNRTQFDIIVMQYFDQFYAKTEEALNTIETNEFQNLCEYGRREKQICHNCFREENIRMCNGVFVLNFENSGYNHNIFDISEIMSRYIKKSQPEPDDIFNVLKAYTDINALSAEEIVILFKRIKFPDKFLQLVNQHYNKRRTWVSQSLVRSLEKAIAVQQKKDEVIDICLAEVGNRY